MLRGFRFEWGDLDFQQLPSLNFNTYSSSQY